MEDAARDCGDDRGDTCQDYSSGNRSGRRSEEPDRSEVGWAPVARTPTLLLIDGDTVTEPPGTKRHPVQAALFRHPSAKLGLTLTPPMAWLLVFYLVSLALLLVNAFWKVDVFTVEIVRDWGLQNFTILWETPVYRTITIRTVSMARAVTVADMLFAFPIAFFAARMASPRIRSSSLLAVVVPLWTSYLIRVFAWKTLRPRGGLFDALLATGWACRPRAGNSLWRSGSPSATCGCPFASCRSTRRSSACPTSFLEASSDLGAHAGMTFRRVIFPLALPGIVAGSIFTFSLTLGDYITPDRWWARTCSSATRSVRQRRRWRTTSRSPPRSRWSRS